MTHSDHQNRSDLRYTFFLSQMKITVGCPFAQKLPIQITLGQKNTRTWGEVRAEGEDLNLLKWKTKS